MASHELRSPLTAMGGYLELLKDDKGNIFTPESQHYIDNTKLTVGRLNNLVNDILEVSRLEQNRIPFEFAAVDPDATIKSSLEEMNPKATEKNLEIIYASQSLPKITVDESRFKQVLVNLISNSIKYTEKGKIEITTESHPKYLKITIADTGIGISAEDQGNLFQKFHRIQSKETSNIIGTGLGLWITKELIEKMGGHISVESMKGVGSHFTVSFPIAKE